MDLFLPREMLAQIAGHLSTKDFNSLARTSKTAKWKLDGYRKETRVDLNLETIAELYDTLGDCYLQLEVHMKAEQGVRCFKSRLCGGVGEQPPTEQKAREREQAVEHHYDRMNPLNSHDVVTSFRFSDALKVHFNFLREKQVRIDKLSMRYMREEDRRDIVRSFPMTGMTVEELHYIELHYSILLDPNFLVACNPKVLTIDPMVVLDDDGELGAFYQLPVIRQLRKLVIRNPDHFYVFIPLNEGDLPALSATHLELSSDSGSITLLDVKTFLNQWMESAREFEYLDLTVGLEVSSKEMKRMITKLDGPFVKVEEVRDDEWTRILRRNDGQQLNFKMKEEERLITISLKTV